MRTWKTCLAVERDLERWAEPGCFAALGCRCPGCSRICRDGVTIDAPAALRDHSTGRSVDTAFERGGRICAMGRTKRIC